MGVRRRALAVAMILLVSSTLAVVGSASPAAAARCYKPLTTDVDGDGLSDLVEAQPYRKVSAPSNYIFEGALSSIPGAAGGVNTNTSLLLSEPSLKIHRADPDYDIFGTDSVLADFNDDCHADLLVGIEQGDIGSGGAVVESNGSTFGLYNLGTDLEGDSMLPGNMWVGTVLAAGDFNGDGYADAAIGSWQDDSGQSAYEGGNVVILYGGSTGLTLSGKQVWNLNSPNVPGDSQPDSRFGWSITTGDFNHDGYTDLAAGAPFQSVGGVAKAGAVVVLNGSSSGLTAAGSQMFTEGPTGVGGSVEAGDTFGGQLAAGDVNGDGYDDLVVAATGEVDGGAHGTIFLIKGSSGGLTTTGSQFRDQHFTGFPTTPTLMPLGESLAVADFNHDGYADIAAGASSTTVSGAAGAGAVAMIYGTGTGLSTTGSVILTEDTAGVPGTAEAHDAMGQSVRVLAKTSTVYPTLVVGVPGESSSGSTQNGGFIVFHGSGSGVTPTGSLYYDGADLSGGVGANAELGHNGAD